MKIPDVPPSIGVLIDKIGPGKDWEKINRVPRTELTARNYPHWEELRHRLPPAGYTLEEWWLGVKLSRLPLLKPIPLNDKRGQPFRFCIPDIALEALHEIDMGAGSAIGVPEPITNAQTRERYLVRSLMEEAITSSQLEGAATTREVAKEMIRSGRVPRNTGEQMILNNYETMRRITTLKDEALSPEVVFEIHRLVTEKTLEDPSAAGRFREAKEKLVVGDDYGEVFHEPPPAGELGERLEAMCDFANGKTPDFFIHPAARAIILHFWLAYDHPFVDGNGRTARALFYWAMLRRGYWLFEFISISAILRKAPAQYGRSFLYTETDDNDLTYFIVAQTRVIRKAIAELHAYIERKTNEIRELESHTRALAQFNHRQVLLIQHALKHPAQLYTFTGHQKSHEIVYQTARNDLLGLAKRGVLEMKKRGRQMIFAVPADLAARLRKMGTR